MSEIDDLEATVWLGRNNGGFLSPEKLSFEKRRSRGYLGSSSSGNRKPVDSGRRTQPSLPKFKCLDES